MDTEDSIAHFAWDLLDSAKQLAGPRATEAQAASKPDEQATQPKAPHMGSERQFDVRTLTSARDTPPIEEHKIDPFQSTTAGEKQPDRAALPVPETETSPTREKPPEATTIQSEAATTIEQASTKPPQPEPPVQNALASASRPREFESKLVSGQQLLPLQSNGDVLKLSWSDVGMTTEPGQYKSRYGLVQIRADEIWIWKMHPNATFVVMQPSPYSDQEVSRLGSFDLGPFALVER
ncbi:hypothetical protein FFI89_007295 [Bradyrhizobium sp. KBS0727]|uniref:hypothetical protein n=1 Tax=unclassified Bradyrhizobium TaxID=2631580 RepID=UPI00110D333C|nr:MULTISPECIES: hypothetical protein [unclassified Bradyrhizobium]QDW36959.1 hypothetical protein FFI71_007295 [Bradyrhizobium sp. KBS0725]QDW43559.1 hypothetical protein FFI89_007295 [Bradyrhizobium sp. KBS0727]